MNKKMVFIALAVLLGIVTLIFFNPNSICSSKKNVARSKGYLGVSVERLPYSLKKELDLKKGVRVTHVEEDSPADNAGITEDDIILEVDNKRISRPKTLARIVKKIKPGMEVKVLLIRDEDEKTVAVKIGERKRGPFYSLQSFENFHVNFKGFPYLGVSLQKLNKELAKYFGVDSDDGALIVSIEKDSPAKDSGLKAGDVIIKIEGKDISSPSDVNDAISEAEIDDEISIEIIRHKKKKSLTAVIKANNNPNYFLYKNKIPKFKKWKKNLRKLDKHFRRFNYRFDNMMI